MVLELIAIALVGTGVIWIGTRWLEPAANTIARAYRLPSIVQGAILIAAASSFPELASVVLASLRHQQFELGVAAIIGSAIFNVLVIPAVVVFFGDDPVDASRELVYKDAQFYLLAIVVTFLTFTLAVVYVPLETGGTAGEMTRWLVMLPLALYGIYIGVHYLDIIEGDDPLPDAYARASKAFVGFIGGIVAILIGVEALLHAAIEFGELFDTPSYLWGLTIVAIGTSLPDMMLSIRAVQAQRPVVSLSNVFGSNIFDLLVAIPAGVLVAGTVTVQLERSVPMFGFLVMATVVAMAAMRTALALSRREAYLLMLLYMLFAGWVLLESVGLVNLIG